MVEGSEDIGSHLVVDLIGCNKSPENLEVVLNELCRMSDARIVAGPAPRQIGKRRYGLVVISTSHLRAAEYAQPDGSVTLSFDLFTCKEDDKEGKKREEANPDAISPRFPAVRPYWFNTFDPSHILTYDPNHRRRKISSARRVPGENANTYTLEELEKIEANHVFLDCGGGNAELMRSRQEMVNVLRKLCPGGQLKMGTDVHELGYDFEPRGVAGVTSVVVTPYGSASAHTWPEKGGFAAIDVVSFERPLDVRQVEETASRYLGSPHDRIIVDPENRVYSLKDLEARTGDKTVHVIRRPELVVAK